MSFPFSRVHLLFLAMGWVAGLIPQGLSAQTSLEEVPPTFRIVSSVGSFDGLKYEPFLEEGPVSISLRMGISRKYPLPEKRNLILFREIPPPADSPPGTPPTRQIVLNLDIPAAGTHFLIVTRPRADDFSSGLLEGVVLKDDSLEHGPREMLVMNLSDFEIGLLIDQEKYLLPPGDSRFTPLPESSSSVVIRVAANSGTEWKLIYQGEKRLSPYHRGYLVLSNFLQQPGEYLDPDPPPVRTQSFFEFAPSAVEALRNSRGK